MGRIRKAWEAIDHATEGRNGGSGKGTIMEWNGMEWTGTGTGTGNEGVGTGTIELKRELGPLRKAKTFGLS
jgi:hypothetical protein